MRHSSLRPSSTIIFLQQFCGLLKLNSRVRSGLILALAVLVSFGGYVATASASSSARLWQQLLKRVKQSYEPTGLTPVAPLSPKPSALARMSYAPNSPALSTTIVISQVYGGGGNTGAPYTHDFIELFNRGTSSVNVNGWSVQYASATGTSWTVTPLGNLTIAPGRYLLIQEAGGANGVALPTPEVVASGGGLASLGATSGKVALVNSTTALTGSGCPFAASVVDFVGYGTTANCSEGANAPAPSNTNAALRKGLGCTETDSNSSDFATGAPNPRNGSSSAITVNDTGDAADANAGNGICATSGSVCTLRAALEEANALAACGTVIIKITATGTITLGSALPAIARNVHITGPGASSLIVSGNNSVRPFTINSGQTVTISALTIANGRDVAQGGGIRNSGTLTLNNCAVTGNTAPQGGGIENDGTLTMTNCTVSNNTQTGTGFGGGMAIFGPTTTLTNCTFSNNQAVGDGGAIDLEAGTLTLTNCTIANNQSTGSGSGGLNAAGGTSILKNTIIANNTAAGDANIKGVVDGSSSFNLIGLGYSGGLTSGVQGNQVGVANPGLAPLGNYGSATPTRALLPGSPAINAGTSSGAPATDQRGSARVGATDIGAFESQGFTLAVASGNNQATVINTNFANPLAVTVMASNTGEPVNGGQVTFTPPGSGASANIAGNPAPISSGTAISGTVTANGTAGTYNVAASANGAALSVNFSLINNTAPMIVTNSLTRRQGNQPINTQIATVMDVEDDENNLAVTVDGGAMATVHGVTVSNLTVNSAGQVRADIAVTCMATDANFTLAVTDSLNAATSATLMVTVPANTPPAVGNYPNTTVVTGGTLTITPDAAPTDNNTIASVTAVAAPATFTGAFSGNTSSGGVTVTGANPSGDYTVTVSLTDNCGATTTRNFTLTVSACGAVLSKPRELFAANGGADSFTVTLDPTCTWTAVSDNPSWITVTAPTDALAGSGTVSYTVASHSGPTRRLGSITVAGQAFRVMQGAQFSDVPLGHIFYTEIGKLSALGITLGCDTGRYCPDANTTREQMAIFIERSIGVFNPPVPMQQTFADVPPTLVGYPFIEDFVTRGITLGCDAGPPRLYCPTVAVTREQMAIFIMRGLGVFTPPAGPATPTFADVPNSGATDYSYEFIEEFARRGITRGCDAGPPRRYCPADPVTRAQMAVFLLRAFGM